MMHRKRSGCYVARCSLALGLMLLALASCGGEDHDHATEADDLGVGAQCTNDQDCEQQSHPDDTSSDIELTCLTQFAGGYCGLDNCQGNEDCPDGSACVRHDDGRNYCFRRCVDKGECNVNRDPDVESNCSSNIDFVEPTSGKACVPPSSGV